MGTKYRWFKIMSVTVACLMVGLGIVYVELAYGFRQRIRPYFFRPNAPVVVSPGKSEPARSEPASSEEDKSDIEVVASGLSIPWEIHPLPDGSLLVTERAGRLLIIESAQKVIPIAGVRHVGEGGLLGLAIHPDFLRNHWIYLYLTTADRGGLTNRVERYELVNHELRNRQLIIESIPGAAYHDGGRIKFGPDRMLYITTGDAGQEALAQDKNSFAGKILRVTDHGQIPSDNPFGNAVYSYGHRNSQGIAWDAKGQLWATEHGRSGVQSGLDELNVIIAGRNYGWPIIEGDEEKSGMERPVINSGPLHTWAPSGAVFWDGSIFFAGLRGEALYEVSISGTTAGQLITHLSGQFGRLRTINLGQDGYFYIATNNTDGRGQPKTGDDKIFRLNPKMFR